ncbi:hypothetical protein [Streptomyces celluloflavus]|uniref:hypothetical protein n=1 Tax=Streptomyces celluloflavus TaxID=58344 RepID=UPI0036794256
MMHGLLVAPSPSVSTVGLREGVEVFGGPDLHGATRVEMQVRVCLSFAEILGLLLYTPGLTYEDLESADEIRELLQFAMLDTSLLAMERKSERAMSEYDDALDGDGWPFVRRLAETVTRVFGVAA